MTNEEVSSPRAEVQAIKNLAYQYAMLMIGFKAMVLADKKTASLLMEAGQVEIPVDGEGLAENISDVEVKMRSHLNRLKDMRQLTPETFNKYFQQA